MKKTVRAELIIDLRGGFPDYIIAESGEKEFIKGNIYILPADYDFSNGYFRKIEEIKIGRTEKTKEVNNE